MSIANYHTKLVLLLSLTIAACSSTPTANMDFDPGYDFSNVQKIAIQPVNRNVVSQAVLSDIQIGRVNESITAQLEQRGLQVVNNNAEADLLLAWHLVTQERTDVRTFDSVTRYNCWNCRGMGMGTSNNVVVRQYTRGTFIIDMIDPDRLQAVWRSVVESRMPDLSNATRAAEARDAAVATALADFPPT